MSREVHGHRQPLEQRRSRDFYRTWDPRAVAPLLRFLPQQCRFIEPCAGAGDLTDQLTAHGHQCLLQCDIEPQRPDILQYNALHFSRDLRRHGVLYITNPPWRRDWLHPLIMHLSEQADTWLLFDAGWVHNKTTPPEVRQRLAAQVSVGRVKWFEDSEHDYSKDIAWHLFKRDWKYPFAMQFGRSMTHEPHNILRALYQS